MMTRLVESPVLGDIGVRGVIGVIVGGIMVMGGMGVIGVIRVTGGITVMGVIGLSARPQV